jgi:hypothetical protein
MSFSRRKFISNLAVAGGTALATSKLPAAPYQASVQGRSRAEDAGPHTLDSPVAIQETMAMGSGAPLGGIGTGFVEVRADGCFYEWQIFNSGLWAQKATTAPGAPVPSLCCTVGNTVGFNSSNSPALSVL